MEGDTPGSIIRLTYLPSAKLQPRQSVNLPCDHKSIMPSRSKLLTLATTTIPRILQVWNLTSCPPPARLVAMDQHHLQIINAATILLHSSFLSIWWSKQQSVANSGCFAPLLALSTFVGAFALVTASTLQFKRLARTVPPMGKIAADGLVATFCVAGGSVSVLYRTP